MNETEVWMILVGLAFLFSLTLEGVWRGVCKLLDMGKHWVLTIDGDSQQARIKRLKIKPDWVIDGKEGRAYATAPSQVLDAVQPARVGYGEKWGKLYTFDALTGLPLKAPSGKTIKDHLQQRGWWVPADSGAIHRKLQRNVKQDMVDPQAGLGKPNLILVIVGGLMVALTFGLMGYMMGAS